MKEFLVYLHHVSKYHNGKNKSIAKIIEVKNMCDNTQYLMHVIMWMLKCNKIDNDELVVVFGDNKFVKQSKVYVMVERDSL